MKLKTVFTKISGLVIVLLIINIITGIFLLFTDNTHQSARDISVLSAAVTHTRSAYQIFFYERSEKNKLNLTEALKNLDSAIVNNSNENNISDEIKGLLHSYTEGIVKTEEMLMERGLNEESGLEGKFRKNVKKIEKQIKESGVFDLELIILRIRRHEKDFFLRKEPKYIESVKKAVAEFSAAATALAATDPAKQVFADNIQSYLNDFLAAANLITISQAEYGKVNELLDKSIIPAMQTIQQQKAAQAIWIKNMSISVIVIGAIGGFILAILLARRISRPIIALSQAAANVAKGDYSVTLPIISDDETGTLTDTFNQMVAEMRMSEQKQQEYLRTSVSSILAEMNKFSDGDLTVQVIGANEGIMAELTRGFNHSVHTIRELVQQLQEGLHQVMQSSGHITDSTNHMYNNVQEQTARILEVVSSVEEMSHTVRENAASATQTANDASKGEKIAEEGGKQVLRTVEKMKTIAESSASTAEAIRRLHVSTNEIGEIVDVISDIADQTNLLALNAAIEAARAGEQGRGFAVVADEVRKLAERTMQATKQIITMIRGVQQDTNAAVLSTEEEQRHAREGMELADTAGEALTSIVGSVRKVQEMVAQIAAATEEQSAAIDQMAEYMTGISTSVEQSRDDIESISQRITSLNGVMMNVGELASAFIIGNSEAAIATTTQKPLKHRR